jgi:hypothetical protein
LPQERQFATNFNLLLQGQVTPETPLLVPLGRSFWQSAEQVTISTLKEEYNIIASQYIDFGINLGPKFGYRH